MEGATQWRRAGVNAVPALAAVAGLGWALVHGAIAATFTVQNQDVGLTTSSLYGTDFGLAVVDLPVKNPDGTTTKQVGRLGFADGRINELCLTVPQTVLGVKYTIKVTAGDHDPSTWEITSGGIQLDAQSATGQLNLDGEVDIGVDGSTVSVDGMPGALGAPGDRWGLDAGIAKFHRVRATVHDLNVQGALQLPNLSIDVLPGTATCPDQPAPVGSP